MNTTATPTLEAAKASHPLAPAVLRQLGGDGDAVHSAIDAATHGADGGFNGFVYNEECKQFVRANKAAIRRELAEFADCTGDGVLETIHNFRCLGPAHSLDAIGSILYGDGSDAGDDADMIYSALAWYALETVGQAIRDLTD